MVFYSAEIMFIKHHQTFPGEDVERIVLTIISGGNVEN